VLAPSLLLAHAGRPPEPHDVWTDWRPSPLLLILLALASGTYARGLHTVWTRAGRGAGISAPQAIAFGSAIGSLLVALASPVDLVSSALFSVHMVQHLILVLVAAPLIAYARPEIAVLWALPANTRRRLGRWWVRRRWLHSAWRAISAPPVAWTMHAVALWAWHTPRLYDAAARVEAFHILEHASFLVTAVLFARPLVARTGPASRRLSAGAAMLYLFAAAMQSGILGALLTLSQGVWYTAHLTTTGPWGLTPLEDQQIAGVLMWGPAGGAYLIAILWAMRGWLESPRQRPRPRLAGAGGGSR
jgi:cytochrome c oxidase assembly factor CtaG